MVEFDQYVFDVRDVRVGDEVGVGVGGEVPTVGGVKFDLAIFCGALLDGEKLSAYLEGIAASFPLLDGDVLDEVVTFGRVLVGSRDIECRERGDAAKV